MLQIEIDAADRRGEGKERAELIDEFAINEDECQMLEEKIQAAKNEAQSVRQETEALHETCKCLEKQLLKF